MAVRVPDTNTYSLDDVWDAVKDHASGTDGDLSDCFVNAVSSYFDPDYDDNSYAPANSMKRFRNYGPPICYVSRTEYQKHYSVPNDAKGIWMASTGLVMYVVQSDSANSKILEYRSSNAWDLSSFYSYSNKSLTANKTYVSLFFSSDGYAFYVVNTTDKKVEKWTMTWPWNIASASYDSSFDYSAIDTGMFGLSFNPTGTKMYMTGNQYYNTRLYELSFSTGFDLDTFSGSFHVEIDEIHPLVGVFVSGDGKRIYTLKQASNTIRQLNLGTAYDLSSYGFNCYGYLFSAPWEEAWTHDLYIRERIQDGELDIFFTDYNYGRIIHDIADENPN